ncbi:E3 ubiquitin-protein ligase TRIM39-like [Cygnus atratus]|uniref:E3 ubiquitin-protein ligase TRIM39-like n=1 Tax=Cygnus atratus TaxID=8868 RepID=UPI0015D5805B|nr:E3 ubiquitin-protein ligase TRIM39-like [Cygnus atratus]
MASQSPSESLQGEASCSICLGYFQEPVSIPCGHNFCRECITRCWEGLEANFSCPQCRQTASHKSFRPSRELAKIAEIAQQLSLQAGRGAAGHEGWCQQHQEALKLFCKEDQQPICTVCDRSQAHRFHTVLPAEEAAQEYKEEIQARLQLLKEEREKYLESRKSRARKNLYLEKTKNEGKKIVCEFEQLHQFLKDQERLLLTQLADLDRAISRVQEEAVVKVSEEMAHLDTLIWEMEGKFQQPASKFLLDIRRLLKSCEVMKFNPPVEISPSLERRLEDFLQKNVLVRCTLRKCQDSLMFKLQEPTNVTLDPATAHPNLHLSEDQKQVRGQLVPQDLPDNPERFDFEPCVLGCQGFTSGRHFWEVEVGQGGVWALGVARETAKRKGPMSLTPKEGIWALEAYHSLTSPRANVRLNQLPRRIWVSLDYEGGRVAFFSSDDGAPILVYSRASFNGERVLPWFKMGMGARLQEITQNSSSEEQSMTGQLMSPLDWVGFRSPLRISQDWGGTGRERSSPIKGIKTGFLSLLQKKFRQILGFLKEAREGLRGRRATLECRNLEDLLEDLKNEIEKRQAKASTKLSEEISQLDSLTKAQDKKSQQSDVKSLVTRCGKVTFQLPVNVSPEPEERFCHFSWRSSALKETLKKLQASITLDPDTAHPDLILSEDRKSVRRGEARQDLPDNPKRFDYWPFVLGYQSFATGRHCWEVEVGDEGDWAIGVAKESIARKGQLSLCPKGGIWGVEKWGGQVRALTTHKVTLLPLRMLPRRVSVHLDYAGGTVAFFDADEGGLIFIFSRASFTGERVRPWLWVVGARSQLRLCP